MTALPVSGIFSVVVKAMPEAPLVRYNDDLLFETKRPIILRRKRVLDLPTPPLVHNFPTRSHDNPPEPSWREVALEPCARNENPRTSHRGVLVPSGHKFSLLPRILIPAPVRHAAEVPLLAPHVLMEAPWACPVRITLLTRAVQCTMPVRECRKGIHF